MIRLAGLALMVLAGAAAHAQDDSDKVRLDDFSLPATEQAQPLEQVSRGTTAPLPEQARDRTLARPARSEAAGTTATQLTDTDDAGPVTQLASPTQSRTGLAGAAANPGDRVPGAVQRIGGQDKCDPQLERAALAECLRILELRAAEFSAPGPAVLSPEQRLLGELRDSDDRLARSSSAMRLRLATTGEPDADLESNQELAAVYLGAPEAPAQPLPAETDQTASLIELLQNLGIQTGQPAGGN